MKKYSKLMLTLAFLLTFNLLATTTAQSEKATCKSATQCYNFAKKFQRAKDLVKAQEFYNSQAPSFLV